MAQIIRHRRGTLEQLDSATLRQGEILVVTGSSGISADNTGSFAVIGTEFGLGTPSNKVLTGASLPDLSSGYGKLVEGIPFYDTTQEKLFLLNNTAAGGHTLVKAEANLGGTNVYSSSQQVADDVLTNNQSFDFGSGTLTTTGLSSFAIISGSSIDLTGNAKVDGSITIDTNASVGGDLDVTGQSNFAGISGSSLDITGNAKIDGNIIIGGEITLGDGDSDTIALSGDITTDIIPEPTATIDIGSSAVPFTEIHGANIYGTINANNGVVSGSGQLTDMTGDITVDSSGESSISSGVIVNDDVNASAAIAHTKLDFGGSGIASGSGQVVEYLLDQATDFGTGRVSGDNFGDAAGTSTFTGSFNGDGAGLTGVAVSLNVSSSDDGTNFELAAKTEAISFAGTSNEVDVTVDGSTNTVQIGLPNDVVIGNDLTVTGNFTVSGTQTIVDSTTVEIGDNIIELNGSGATNGGLLVKDMTDPNRESGSLLWDSTNDYWKAGVLGSEGKIFTNAGADNLVSGSSQITLTGAVNTGFDTSYVAEHSSRLYYTDTRVKTKLDAEGVVSQSLLNNLTNAEVNQLENIGTSTISATQWGYVGAMDQDVTTTSNVNFGNIDASGYVSASNVQVTTDLNVEGNVSIDGNITIGGDLTLGNETGDTIAFSGQVSTDILSNGDNTLDLGASNNRFAEIHGTNIYGAINATNNVVSGSSNTSTVAVSITDGVVSATAQGGVVSGSAQTVEHLLNSATDFGTGRVSGDNFGDAAGTSTFTGSFNGDGSSLTGINSELTLSGSDGVGETIQSVNTPLTFEGGTGLSSTVSGGTITYSVQDASTSQKGLAQFADANFAVSSGNVTIKDGGVSALKLNADVVGDGLELDGVTNDINVIYGPNANESVEGNTVITFDGTANEVEVTGGAVTLGGGNTTVTIGLPDDVTITDTLTVNGNVQLGNATTDTVTVAGNLYVQGTTTTVDSTTVQIGDNILELNFGGAETNAGLLVTDATGDNLLSGSLLWNGTNDYWMGGAQGSEKEFARLNASPTSNTVLKSDANGLLVDSTITDDGTDVSITGDLTINGLTADSFIYADSNKQLSSVAVTADDAGALIQWNGSSFIASNEIDGGSF